MTKTMGISVLLAVAGAGCGANDTEPTPSATVTEPQAASDQSVVHASLSMGEGHTLQFVEFMPGVVGLIEKGRVMVDVPLVTPELSELSWSDLYRHFAGASAPIPEGMAAAQARVSAKALLPMSAAPRSLGTEGLSLKPTAPDQRVTTSVGEGPHFYNDAEQAWFKANICVGRYSRDCIQGWQYAWDVTPAITAGGAKGFVGSESNLNATLTQSWWDCAFWGGCYWLEFGHVVIVPGQWASISEYGGSYQIRFDLSPVERNTQVSLGSFY